MLITYIQNKLLVFKLINCRFVLITRYSTLRKVYPQKSFIHSTCLLQGKGRAGDGAKAH